MREREEIYKMRETKGKKNKARERQAGRYVHNHAHTRVCAQQTDRQTEAEWGRQMNE